MDGDIFYTDGTPVIIDGLDATIKRVEFTVTHNSVSLFTIYTDGTCSINQNLTVEQYKRVLGLVIEYFTKGKQ